MSAASRVVGGDELAPVVDDPEPSVGSRLREARRAVGLKQREVAEEIGVTRRAVYEWEADLRLPHSALPALAKLYGTSVSQLLHGVEPASVELAAMRGDMRELLAAMERYEAAAEQIFSTIRELDGRLMVVLDLVEQLAALTTEALEQAAERRQQP